MPEHRSQPRVEARQLVSIEFVDKEGMATQFMGRSLDLSETGIQLEVMRAYPIFTVLTLSLCIGEDILAVKGRVVHVKSSQENRVAIGVHFLDLGDQDKAKIKKYLNQRQDRPES